jgi:hypothetical protein
MKRLTQISLIFCGLLMLAAFPVFAQNSEPVRDAQLNKKPIQDFADYVLEKVEKDKVDLSQPFKVVLEGALIKNSENNIEIVVFDKKKSKWLSLSKEEAGDPEIVEIAKETVEAVGDTGFLGYLYNFGIKDLKITFYQNDSLFAVNLESKQETKERANILASGLNGLIKAAEIQVKGEDEKIIINGFQSLTAKDKTLVINFELPKNTVQEMINQNLTNYKNRKLREQK